MKRTDKVFYQGREMTLAEVLEILQYLCDSNRLFTPEWQVSYVWTQFINYPQSMDVVLNVDLMVGNKLDTLTFNTIKTVNEVFLLLQEKK